MEKPYKFHTFNKVTKERYYYNSIASIPYFHLYDTNVTVYEDTRYEAKKRLFEYLHPEQKPKRYDPFAGTEIGKSIPILNF